MVGLWPFNFHARNNVTWIQTRDGLHFEKYGQAYTRNLWALNENAATPDLSFTIEVWVRPAETRHPQESAILSVYDQSNRHSLSIAQSGSDLILEGRFRTASGTQEHQLRLYDACRSAQPVFVTITSSEDGTRAYVNAKLQQPQPYPMFPIQYVGRLLLGHAPEGQNTWTGDILGLAVYDRVLANDEVAQDYRQWSLHKTDLLAAGRALYIFDERVGDIARNRVGSAPDLYIDPKFRLLHATVLAVPHPVRLHRIDTVLNILGFVPLGFLVCAYLQAVKQPIHKAVIGAIMVGVITSLGIELLQTYLPARDSSLLDLINNILGTATGALCEAQVHNRWVKSVGACVQT
jgi:VanZ family protein